MIRFAIILVIASAYFSPARALSVDLWNDFERDVLTLVNQDRAGLGLGALSGDSRLHDAAVGHSLDMASNNFVDHAGSNGSNAGQRATSAGYDWNTWGENIAAGYLTAESVFAGWLGSPGHRDNMRNGAFTDIGIAYIEAGPGTEFDTYWTMVLAAGDSVPVSTGPGETAEGEPTNGETGTETGETETGEPGTGTPVEQVVVLPPFPDVTQPQNAPAFQELELALVAPVPLPAAFWMFAAALAAALLLQRRQGVAES